MQAAVSLVSVAIEHSRAEEQLRQTVTRLELAQRIARLGYWERDLTNDRVRTYGEANAILGLRSDTQPTFKDLLKVVLPEDRPAIIDSYDTAYEAKPEALHSSAYQRGQTSGSRGSPPIRRPLR